MRRLLTVSLTTIVAAFALGTSPALATSLVPSKPASVSRPPVAIAPTTPIRSAVVFENRTPCVLPQISTTRCARPVIIKVTSAQTHCWTGVRAYVVSHVNGTVTVRLTGAPDSHSRHLCIERRQASAAVKVVGPVNQVIDAATGATVEHVTVVAW